MKIIRHILLAMLVCVATEATAKTVMAKHLYMFGFSASFKDSVVYFTEIQDLQGVWMDSKTKFLLSRENYSSQLKNYFTEKLQEPNRVCMVLYATTKKEAEKKYNKLKSKYVWDAKKKKKKRKVQPAYDVRYVSTQDFQFEPVEIYD